MTEKSVTFITRAKSNLKYEPVTRLIQTPTYRDNLIWVGTGQRQTTITPDRSALW